MDADFGPFFIWFCSYFPYNGKLYINGNVRHEAPSIRAEMKGLRRWAVAAAWSKLGAARPWRRAGGRGAAPTTTGRTGIARRSESGKQDGKAHARNQR
jgi:hypothetical protein